MIQEEFKTYAKETLKLTETIVSSCGNRLAGMPGSKKAAEMLEAELQKHCDSVNMESFTVQPEAFIGFMKVLSTCYFFAALMLILGSGIWLYFAAIILSIAVLNAFSQFVFYWEIFDKFYKKKTGYNVFGTINPSKEIKQQIIFAGHHDAVHVFNFLESKYQKWYSVRIIGGLVPAIVAAVMSYIWVVQTLLGQQSLFLYEIARVFFIVGYVSVLPLFFFVNKKYYSPGAGDNMIASVLATKFADIFGTAKKNGSNLLQHTKLILASMDAEESGLRGARAYVKKHRNELLKIPTYVFNMDSIYNLDEIQFLSKDINGIQKLSKKMVNECIEVAEKLGYKARDFPFTFGGGGTDAAEFAAIGVEATTLLAMPTEMIRDGLAYHTSRDTVDSIEPEVVEASIKIGYNYVMKKEKDISN